ncbi:MAG: acetyl-CoA C-acyltransferase, partial [Chloroflexi bacterium]|nr:acetyl-CoA C-acyltransferase [Chloroflexota bacterium]
MNSRETRAGIVEGRRTPFVKAGTELAELDVYDLGRTAVVEVIQRSEIDPKEVGQLVFGNVSRPVKYHNLAREIGLASGLPRSVPAFTVSLACASACQAATSGVDQIERGYADVVLAGGAESLSNPVIQYSAPLARAMAAASQAKTIPAKLQSFARVRMADLAPVAPG